MPRDTEDAGRRNGACVLLPAIVVWYTFNPTSASQANVVSLYEFRKGTQMGWYIRRSVRMGPVRWNLSKSGIGVSAGVRGARVGIGPRGPYIAGGRGGIYFRQYLGSSSVGRQAARRLTHKQAANWSTPATVPAAQYAAPMEYVPETNISQFVPASADALAQYIVAQRKRTSLFGAGVVTLVIVNLIVLANIWPIAVVTILLSIVGGYYLYNWDRKRTHIVLHYDLDNNESQNYRQLCAGLTSLASTARLLRVEARQVHGDWKHQAGSTTALKLAPVRVLPPMRGGWLESNVPVLGILWREGKLTLRFLPDRVIIEQAHQVAVSPYANVQVSATLGRFVESGTVPRDARVVGHNWQFPNKDGGPDRRFNNNRQLPVTEAAYIALQSVSGLNLLIQSSSRQTAEAFVNAVRTYQPLVCAAPPPTS